MTNEIVTTNGLVPHNMDEALRLAEFMARARTVPKHLQDSPGDCLMAIEQAMRWGMSPFAVAQATSVISGKLMYEGKLVAAAVETSGAIVGQIDYTFAGEGEGRSITVSATRRGETNPRTVTVAFKDARTGNEMWKRQPDQQLCYHGVRVWARRWTPAVILGVYSREEMGPVIEGEIVSEEPGSLRDAINNEVTLQTAAAKTPRGARIEDKSKVYETSPDDPTRALLGKIYARLSRARSRAEVEHIAKLPSVEETAANAPDWAKRDLDEMLVDAYTRVPEKPEGDGDLDDIEISGEANVMAG